MLQVVRTRSLSSPGRHPSGAGKGQIEQRWPVRTAQRGEQSGCQGRAPGQVWDVGTCDPLRANPGGQRAERGIANMTDELVFYTNPISRGRIVRWMLEEVGQPYRTELLEYGTTIKAPEYLRINPMGKVPALRHGDTVVTEAAAICFYLADAFPDAGLAPAPRDRLRGPYYRWMFFAAGPLEAATTNKAFGLEVPAERKGMVGYGSLADVLAVLEAAVSERAKSTTLSSRRAGQRHPDNSGAGLYWSLRRTERDARLAQVWSLEKQVKPRAGSLRVRAGRRSRRAWSRGRSPSAAQARIPVMRLRGTAIALASA